MYIKKNMVQIWSYCFLRYTHKNISYITVVNRHCTLNHLSNSNSGTIIYRKKYISVTYREVQSFFFNSGEKIKNIHLFIVWYMLIWVDYYAHSTSLCTICISEGKSIFVANIQKNIVKVWSKYFIHYTYRSIFYITVINRLWILNQ